MLTEHVQFLREWYQEDDQEQRPDLNELDLYLIQEEMDLAMKRKCTVKIKSWKNKKFHYHIGTIEKMDAASRSIIYEDPYGQHHLPIAEIIRVMMVD